MQGHNQCRHIQAKLYFIESVYIINSFFTKIYVAPVHGYYSEVLPALVWLKRSCYARQNALEWNLGIKRKTCGRPFSWCPDIRHGQFGAKYIILICQKIPLSFSNIFLKYRFHSAIFFINPASISAIFFHQSHFHFSNVFSSIPLPFQQYLFHFSNFFPIPLPFRQFFSSILLPFQQHLFVIKYTFCNLVVVYDCIIYDTIGLHIPLIGLF